MKLTLNEAALLLVAEVLRAERGADTLPIDDAATAVAAAVKRLRATGKSMKGANDD